MTANGTDTSTNRTTETPTPGESISDVLATDPQNATLADVQTVADWIQSKGAEQSQRQADRARAWVHMATAGRDISVPDAISGQSDSPTATAAPTTSTPTEPVADAPDATNGTDGVRIDSGTVILNSSYDAPSNMTTIVLRSERPQSVTVADQGFFTRGGEVPRRDVRMDAGETTRIRIPSLEVNGDVALSISTRETLYSHYVDRSGGGLGVLESLSSLQAWGAGIIVAFTWMILSGVAVLRREDGSPRRATI